MNDLSRLLEPDSQQDAVTIRLVDGTGHDDFIKALSEGQRSALAAQKFSARSNEVAIVPDGNGWFVAGGVTDTANLRSWCLSALAEKLPAGRYRIQQDIPGLALHGWLTGQYRFDRYQSQSDDAEHRILVTRQVHEIDAALAEARAVNLVCDMVNTPAEDMGPAAIQDEAEQVATRHDASLTVTMGDTLEQEYPMVHAVGRAAARAHAPRMIRMEWGKKTDPVLAIVGKGVAFDSGGLDIKSASGMLLMKKDMGGAAHALALADLVMTAGLPVRLHLLLPAVENAISGNAFRPGDVLNSRKGLRVEIGNTDAEGRLILGDALTRASEDNPDLIIDFATLTGAARVALGPDYPALMTRRYDTSDALIAAGRDHDDEPWRLPLPEQYAEWLNSDIADLNNTHGNSYAGASVAGLFLDRFVADDLDWAHFDTFAWRPTAKPGRPKGGAAYGLRAAFHMLKKRYCAL